MARGPAREQVGWRRAATAIHAGLPWSVEPIPRWTRGERWSHRGDVPDSPGWNEEQKATADRMRAEIRKLAIAVVDHPHGETVPRDEIVAARMELKKQGPARQTPPRRGRRSACSARIPSRPCPRRWTSCWSYAAGWN